jgi:hypothetical protein
LIFAVLFLTLISCKKSSSTIPVPQIPTTNISLKFSGGLYVSSTVSAIYNKNLDAIAIGAEFGNNAFVNLNVANVNVGTFDLSGGNGSLSFTTGTNNVFDTYVSVAGSMKITEFSSTAIVGTFQFTGVDTLDVSRVISEGQFTTNYSTQ